MSHQTTPTSGTFSSSDGSAADFSLLLELSKELYMSSVPIFQSHPTLDEKTSTQDLRCVRRVLGNRDHDYLPGQPRIRLSTSNLEGSGDELRDYLRRVHLTDGLDELLPFMKYIFVQTPSYRHIMPLHHNKAHAREIIVDHDPGLHLVWYHELIYIKPIPEYCYCQAFWDYLGETDPPVYHAALGFMRSYYYLIQYNTDFELACRRNLIPKMGTGDERRHPTYEQFCRFIESFKSVGDPQVCRRYHYGELRLTRLNRTSFFFKGRLAYFHIYPQWGSFLEHMLAPIITVFAASSVVLNSMQVTLTALQSSGGDGDGGDGTSTSWSALIVVSKYFSVAVIILITLVVAISMMGIVGMGFKDLIWAKRTRHLKKNGNPEAGEKSHGTVW